MEVKNCTFFTENEDLYAIIAEKIQNLSKDIKKISTGWTNIVLEVGSENENYIVRLPRNDFFAKQIEKDAGVSNFVRNNLGIKTGDMKIEYHNDRPFSIHKKIPGKSLAEKFENLSPDEIMDIAKGTAKYYRSFHSFNTGDLPACFRGDLYEFLSGLPKIQDGSYDYSIFDGMLEDKNIEDMVFVNGDFNPGNILINDRNKIEAFIDFSFCGISDIYSDLARMHHRVSPEFFQSMINEYALLSGKKLDMGKMENRKKMWKYIDESYIKYMKHNNPEVSV